MELYHPKIAWSPFHDNLIVWKYKILSRGQRMSTWIYCSWALQKRGLFVHRETALWVAKPHRKFWEIGTDDLVSQRAICPGQCPFWTPPTPWAFIQTPKPHISMIKPFPIHIKCVSLFHCQSKYQWELWPHTHKTYLHEASAAGSCLICELVCKKTCRFGLPNLALDNFLIKLSSF